VAEDFGGAGGGGAEAEEGLDEGGLARAVGAQEADGAGREGDGEVLQDIAFAEADAEAGEFDDGGGGIDEALAFFMIAA
jgi:hypothetical protein